MTDGKRDRASPTVRREPQFVLTQEWALERPSVILYDRW